MRVAVDAPPDCDLSQVLERVQRRGVRVLYTPTTEVPEQWPRGALTAAAWIVAWAREVTHSNASVIENSPLGTIAFHREHEAVLRPLADAVLRELGVEVVVLRGADDPEWYDFGGARVFASADALVDHLAPQER